MGTTPRALHTVFVQVLEKDVVARLVAEKAALEEELATLRADPPRPCGVSVFEYRGGMYEGDWLGDLCEDMGDSSWYMEVPHGQGEQRGANGDRYTGQWREGDYHGRASGGGRPRVRGRLRGRRACPTAGAVDDSGRLLAGGSAAGGSVRRVTRHRGRVPLGVSGGSPAGPAA